jgi:hypothetical protein
MATYRSVKTLSSVDAAYIAGLVDGEGTITLSRKHAGDGRQLVISISNTERAILDFVLLQIGAGKITGKKALKQQHAPSFAYAIWNRQALDLLVQVQPFLRSYKRRRAELVRDHYVRLTPRNGKYTAALRTARDEFEKHFLALRAVRDDDALRGSASARCAG